MRVTGSGFVCFVVAALVALIVLAATFLLQWPTEWTYGGGGGGDESDQMRNLLLKRMDRQEQLLLDLQQLAELPPTSQQLTVTASFLESTMKEVDFGDFDLDLWQLVHEERMDLFRRRCWEIPPIFVDNDKIYIKENMFLFREYDLSYCHMPKTGSTTVVNHFQQVYEGYRTEEEEAQVEGGQVFLAFQYLTDRVGIEGGKEAILDAFDHTNTFIFVRHPFVRFVSAYRMRYYLISGDIGRRFGMAFNRTEMPEFKLFVDYYLENEEQFQSVYLRDKHFRTISGQCDVCNLGVDVIGRSETFDWDMAYLQAKFGVPFENLELRKHVRTGDSSEDLTKEWFGTITKKQIRKLYDIYQVDFVLYGYNDSQDYIDLGLE